MCMCNHIGAPPLRYMYMYSPDLIMMMMMMMIIMNHQPSVLPTVSTVQFSLETNYLPPKLPVKQFVRSVNELFHITVSLTISFMDL